MKDTIIYKSIIYENGNLGIACAQHPVHIGHTAIKNFTAEDCKALIDKLSLLLPALKAFEEGNNLLAKVADSNKNA